METKFFMMVGLPGCGKSIIAEEMAKSYDCNVYSSDSIREEINGDARCQDNKDEVFALLHKRIKDDLRAGKSCIYDATNINWKRRQHFLSNELRNINCKKVCILVAKPYEECLKDNGERDRVVPTDVIERMYKNFHIPYYYEGWDDIEICYASEYRFNIDEKIDSLMKYDQGSKYHSLTLGGHLKATCDWLLENTTGDGIDLIAALLHDIGKPFCRTEDLENNTAHYYNHQNVGAYDSLFLNSLANERERLDLAVTIMHHMDPYFWKSHETVEKYRTLWGVPLYLRVMKLHNADKAAH